MGCATCGEGVATPPEESQQFVVTLPNGARETVTGEHAAKVKVTMAGGGRYEPVK